MPEILRHDDDTDIESFEREEKRMEEEAAKVRYNLVVMLKYYIVDRYKIQIPI